MVRAGDDQEGARRLISPFFQNLVATSEFAAAEVTDVAEFLQEGMIRVLRALYGGEF